MFNPNKCTLSLMSAPTDVSFQEIQECLKAPGGFEYLSISAPLPHQGFNRFVWAHYQSEEET